MNQQLALAIQLNDEATLTDFCWGDNGFLRDLLATSLQDHQERFIYLWGNPGSGKSHLLQAYCHEAMNKHSAIYLPLNLLHEWGPDILEDMEHQSLICIDALDIICANKKWEEALFHLYNRVRDNEKTTLLIAAEKPPAQLGIVLSDLASRLAWGQVIQLHDLDDEAKLLTLKRRAHKRGFALSDDVGRFLIRRCSRNLHALNGLLDQLDNASLVAQRKITIPFAKQILGI